MSAKEKTLSQVIIRADETTGALPNTNIPQAWYKLVREMRRDPTIALARELVLAPLLAAQWSFEATEDAPEGAVELLEDVFLHQRIRLLRHTMRGFLDFGWQGFEKVWKVRDDGKAVISKFKPLLQDITEIQVDTAGKIIGLLQDVDQLTLPLENILVLSNNVEGTNWYGEPIMRGAEDPYQAWKLTSAAASKYDTKVSGAHWVVYYPTSPGQVEFRGVMTSTYDVAMAILAGLESNGRIAIPRGVDEMMDELMAGSGKSSWGIELLSDKGAGTTTFIDRMKYLDSLKVRAFGLPERSVLEGQYGTKAEAGEHADFAITALDVKHQEIVMDINDHAVDSVLEMNYGATARGAVAIQVAPVTDDKRAFLQKVYSAVLANTEGFAVAMSTLDVAAMQEQLNIPAQA
jgi:hypothetical protein